MHGATCESTKTGETAKRRDENEKLVFFTNNGWRSAFLRDRAKYQLEGRCIRAHEPSSCC